MVADAGQQRRIWRFANAVFDEGSWKLTVGGASVEIEVKPLEILQELLEHAGEVVSKDQLFDAVWPNTTVVEASLTTAISKLRDALQDHERNIVQTVPRLGYKLEATVDVIAAAGARLRYDFEPGDTVPRRPQWKLVRALGNTGHNDVWLAEQSKTGERRVFKFASTPNRLRALKREATLSRLLQASFGLRPDLVRQLEWNFDEAPMFIESAYGGEDLAAWAEARGGLLTVPLGERLRIIAAAARTAASAHSVGVLHKDIKPGNLLIDDDGTVKLVDFGSGRLLDDTRLKDLAITGLGLTHTRPVGSDSLTGTYLYLAPELLAGGYPTIQSDVYALGVLLYQMTVGDFSRPLSAGWEADVEDELIRQDIADAANGTPARRLLSAEALAERLETLDSRRAAQAEVRATQTRLTAAEQLQARVRARRPWVIAAGVALSAGLIGTSVMGLQAVRQRDEANRQAEIARKTYAFLADDFLGKVDPTLADSSTETVAAATKRASINLDQRFQRTPLIAGRLHVALAKAFAARSEYSESRHHFKKAINAFESAGPSAATDLATATFEEIGSNAFSADETGPGLARSQLEKARKRWGNLESLPAPADYAAAVAEGGVASASDDPQLALKSFQRASQIIASRPQEFSDREEVGTRQKVIYALLRLGEGEQAQKLATELIAASSRKLGFDHPDTLLVRLNLAQSFMLQRNYQAAVDETSALLPVVEQRFGSNHARVVRILGTRMEVLKGLGRFGEAIADGERHWRTAARVYGESSYDAIGGRSDTAAIKCRIGDTTSGVADARAAVLQASKSFGPEAALTQGIKAGALSDCLIEAKRYDEAEKLLEGLDGTLIGQLVGNPDYGVQIELGLAHIAVAKGNLNKAARHFEAAKPGLALLEKDADWKKYIDDIRLALSKSL